jgi:hypothetical protein
MPTCVIPFGQRQLQELPLLGHDTMSIRAYTAPQETVVCIISALRASNFVKERISLDSYTITAYLRVQKLLLLHKPPSKNIKSV